MVKPTMKNLHVPLPEPLYDRLRTEAHRMRRPATELAREAIDLWLHEEQRSALHKELLDYARAAAGTTDDLDPELERAAVELLHESPLPRKKGGRR